MNNCRHVLGMYVSDDGDLVTITDMEEFERLQEEYSPYEVFKYCPECGEKLDIPEN